MYMHESGSSAFHSAVGLAYKTNLMMLIPMSGHVHMKISFPAQDQSVIHNPQISASRNKVQFLRNVNGPGYYIIPVLQYFQIGIFIGEIVLCYNVS
jgi:hypothetical protein